MSAGPPTTPDSAGAAGEPWLSVVGIGAEGLGSLGERARAVVEAGEVLVGGARHLAMLPEHAAERLAWDQPLAATLDRLAARRDRRVVVLATGDPMCFGVGELLARHFGVGQLRVLPAPSVFSLVCARLGWSRQAVTTLSVHGRPLAALHRHLLPGARLIVLSHDGTTPAKLARLLTDAGFGPSFFVTLEDLGGARERQVAGVAEDWATEAAPETAALNTVAIECRASDPQVAKALVPGLADELFETDGQLTKREIRAATLARLAPLPGQRLWDVGAGSGAIAIEWLRAAAGAAAVAIERDPARAARIGRNAERLGTPELVVIEAQAPDCLAGLAAPDAVFIGGGLAGVGLLARCWQALSRGGRLVANAVTLGGEQALLGWHQRHGGDLTRFEISRVDQLGSQLAWRPALPVIQLAATKS